MQKIHDLIRLSGFDKIIDLGGRCEICLNTCYAESMLLGGCRECRSPGNIDNDETCFSWCSPKKGGGEFLANEPASPCYEDSHPSQVKWKEYNVFKIPGNQAGQCSK